LIRFSYFQVNRIRLTYKMELSRSYHAIDSFVLLVCMGGEGFLRYEGGVQPIMQGATILLPALLKDVVIGTDSDCLLLEVYV